MKPAQRVRALVDRHGDALLAAALTLVTQLEVWTIRGSYLEAPRLPIAVTTLVMTLALAWRRRAPLAMAAATSALWWLKRSLPRHPIRRRRRSWSGWSLPTRSQPMRRAATRGSAARC